MKKYTKIKPTLLTLDKMIQSYEEDIGIQLDKKINYKKVLLNKKDCNNLFGIKNEDGSRNITRYSLPDFYYDLVKHITKIENKLILSDQLELEHYLYQLVQKKAVVPQLQHEMHTYTTLIYAQNDACSHWNKAHLLLKEKRDEIIFDECIGKGIESFNILTKIFSPQDFLNAISYGENTKDNKFSLNLSEHLLFNIIYKDLKEAQPLIDVFLILKELGTTVDYQKIFNLSLFNPKNIDFESLNALKEKSLENYVLSTDYSNSNGQPYILKDYVKYNNIKNQFKNTVRKKDIDLLKTHKEEIIRNGLWQEVSYLLSQDVQITFKKEIKNIFDKLHSNLHYHTLNILNNEEINQLIVPEYYRQANKKSYTLIEFSRDYFLAQSLFDIFTKGKGKGLNGEIYDDIKDIKTYIVNNNLLDNIVSLININKENSINKDTQKQWAILSIELKLLNQSNITNHKKVKL